jgi:SAM-dependent methyltransferase
MSEALYDRIGVGYSAWRRPDARIAARIADALGPARTIVNVGAGAGCTNRRAGPAVRATAERLPFRDRAFDAAMAVLTIHHWPDWRAGIDEMRRVARGPVAILTWDPEHPGFWLVQDYFPEILEMDLVIMPRLAEIGRVLEPCEARPVPIPADCSDGFLGAYWRRPEMYLDAGARGAISSFAKIANLESRLDRLRADLADGTWERRYGSLRALPELDVGYRLIVA